MKTQKFKLVLLLFFLVISAKAEKAAHKGAERFNITHLTTDNGLSHNLVDDLLKDSNGYLWAGTGGEGLVRFDGYEFISFNMGSGKGQLRSNFIQKLIEDNFHRLWIVSDVGIDILDLNRLDIVKIDDSNKLLSTIQKQTASYIHNSKKGNIWVCSMNKLFKITFHKNGMVNKVVEVCTLPEGESIHAICEVDDYIWFNYNNGIYRIKESTMKRQEPSLISKALRLPDIYITVIRKATNEIWIGSHQGLFRYNIDTEQIKHYTHRDSDINSISQNMITDIVIADDNSVLVATLKGINYYNSMTDNFERINRNQPLLQSSFIDDNNLNCNFVNCLLNDGDIIWAGTETGGINKLSKRTLFIKNYYHLNELPGSLSMNPVNAIFEDKTGSLWVGTVEGGLNKKTPSSEYFTHYTTSYPASLTHNSVSCFTTDNNDRLWIGTWGGGFGWIDLKSNNIHFNHISSKEYADASLGFVGTLCYDSLNQVIWVGTGEKIYTYDLNRKKIEIPLFKEDLGGIDGCTGYLIENGTYLWIGITKGLCRIDLRTYKNKKLEYKLWKYKLDNPESKLTERVTDIIKTHDGTIWVASNGYGFYKSFLNNDGTYTFKGYTTNQGLANNSVRGMEEDKEGRIWISTTNGLSCFDPENESFYNFTRKDGLLSNQFYWNAIGKSKDGEIYLGSINGLSIVKPTIDEGKSKTAPIAFTHVRIADKEIMIKENGVKMHERDKSISIEFAALDYNASNLTAYSYRLKGFDDKWKRVTANHRLAIYTNLGSGDYTFEIRYAADGSNWQQESAILNIHVEPYFYKTIWFGILILILIFIAIYGFISWRINSYRVQQKLLNIKVEERTRELKEQNAKIVRQKEQIVEMSNKVQELTVDKLAFFTNITHEFRTPLTLIIGPIERALKLSYNPQVIEQLNFVERNSKYLLSLINQLMDFRKIESGKMEIVPNPNNLNKFLSDFLLPFKAYTDEHQITLRSLVNIPQRTILFDENAIQKVLTNLMGNAIKFTPKGGLITFYATTLHRNDKDLLYLCVQDNGSGIPNEDLDKIFTRFYQSNNQQNTSVSGQSGTGIGLYLCQQIIQMHHGEITVRNNPVQGCSFRVLLPLIYVDGDDALQQIDDDSIENNSADYTLPKNDDRLNILVVEDNADMRAYIRSILSEFYHVIEAGNGKEALDILNAHNIDFIISDLMMPIMDGMELSKRVKANFNISHIPFLMLTAKTSNETRIESFRIGVDEYLLKPFDDSLLLARIANILENRKRYQQKFSFSMDIAELNVEEESSDKKFLNKAMHIIKENYKDSYYEVTNFIEAMGISKSLMNKKMKNLTGQSAGHFIRNYRLNIARELILKNKHTHNKNISEIAYEVGFNDPKYFTRCFTRHFNQTPSSMMGTEEGAEEMVDNFDEIAPFS